MKVLISLAFNGSAIALLLVWYFDHTQVAANAAALFFAIGGFTASFYYDDLG